MNKNLVFLFVLFCLASAANAQTTTTFRGHTLGEGWQTFIRTEGGLCQLSDTNAHACAQAVAGKNATLRQENKELDARVSFHFEGGHFLSAYAVMKGPKFAELTDLEKTYGKPWHKTSNPKKGEARSYWTFSDGGQIVANERVDDSGRATITTVISSAEGCVALDEYNEANVRASAPVGRRWESKDDKSIRAMLKKSEEMDKAEQEVRLRFAHDEQRLEELTDCQVSAMKRIDEAKDHDDVATAKYQHLESEVGKALVEIEIASKDEELKDWTAASDLGNFCKEAGYRDTGRGL